MTCYPILYVLIHYYFTTIVKVVKLEKSWPSMYSIFANSLVTIVFIEQLVSLFDHFPGIFLDFIIQFIINIWILIFLSLIIYV